MAGSADADAAVCKRNRVIMLVGMDGLVLPPAAAVATRSRIRLTDEWFRAINGRLWWTPSPEQLPEAPPYIRPFMRYGMLHAAVWHATCCGMACYMLRYACSIQVTVILPLSRKPWFSHHYMYSMQRQVLHLRHTACNPARHQAGRGER